MRDGVTTETRRERQARTRAGVIAAAAEVFARHGYDGASVGQIAAAAGYSHGAVYSNFAGKADLFLAVFEDYMATRARELAATQVEAPTGSPIEARARALADQWMERLAADRESFLLQLEFVAHAGRDPGLAARFGARSGSLRDAIAAYIGSFAGEVDVQLPLPATELALLMRALAIGLAVEALVDPEAVRADLYGDFIELLVGALRERPGGPVGAEAREGSG